jgi:hypothetical protein
MSCKLRTTVLRELTDVLQPVETCGLQICWPPKTALLTRKVLLRPSSHQGAAGTWWWEGIQAAFDDPRPEDVPDAGTVPFILRLEVGL